ncbi:MAG: sugar kinase [Armatimonadetes bacterium]|nr:sugar kinase [Armatimonadota bacterium]
MSRHVVTFGEIMMRLNPPGYLRFQQARSFDVTYAGGEANVAASLAQFGVPAQFVTRLPANELADACLSYLHTFGVGTDFVVRGGDRLGIYFLENGAAQRGSKVIYDRSGSSIATIESGVVDWKRAFENASWFHWTGITPAISESLAAVCLEGIRAAKAAGVTVSCDLNFRKKLWKWGKTASQVMPEMVSLCDVAIGNEEDAEQVFGIKAPEVDVERGKVEAGAYRCVAEELKERFPGLRRIAITLRGSISASHNTWSGVLYDGRQLYTGPQYDILPIVDRVGGGDSFAGGLIFRLLMDPDDLQGALDFAVAASCLKHSIWYDFNCSTVEEVQGLLKSGGSGRVQR